MTMCSMLIVTIQQLFPCLETQGLQTWTAEGSTKGVEDDDDDDDDDDGDDGRGTGETREVGEFTGPGLLSLVTYLHTYIPATIQVQPSSKLGNK